jgi:hypothetical protein
MQRLGQLSGAMTVRRNGGLSRILPYHRITFGISGRSMSRPYQRWMVTAAGMSPIVSVSPEACVIDPPLGANV